MIDSLLLLLLHLPQHHLHLLLLSFCHLWTLRLSHLVRQLLLAERSHRYRYRHHLLCHFFLHLLRLEWLF